MPTDNDNSYGLMWQDENGEWHLLEGIQDVNTVTETDSDSILHATTLSDSKEVTIHCDGCTISEETEAMFWAQAEGLDIVKKED